MESFAVYWSVWLLRFVIPRRSNAELFLNECGCSGNDSDASSPYFGPLIYVQRALGDRGLKLYPLAVDIALNGFLPEPTSAILTKVEMVFVGKDGKIDRADGIERTHKWEDVHPGWRFHRIIELWKSNEMLKNVEYLEDDWHPCESDVDWLVHETCGRLAWSTPSENWASYIKRKEDAHEEYQSLLRSVMNCRQLSNGALAFPLQYRFKLEQEAIFWPMAVLCPSFDYSFIAPNRVDTVVGVLPSFLLSHRILNFIEDLYPYWEKGFGCPIAYKQCHFLCDASRAQREACFRGQFTRKRCFFRKFMKKHFVDVSKVVDINRRY